MSCDNYSLSSIDQIDNPSPVLPPLTKWIGGKRKISWLIREIYVLNGSMRLVEPFAGGLGVAFGVNPESVLGNDINPYLIALYKGVKSGNQFTLPMEMSSEMYYQYRADFNFLCGEKVVSWQVAQYFFYLVNSGFNGLWRMSKANRFNVPVGRYSKVNYSRPLNEYAEKFKKWEFTSGDFEAVKTYSEDLIFIDSPYYKTFTSYSVEGFSWEDQVRLAVWASERECPVIVTNSNDKKLMSLYGELGFHVREIYARRSVGAKGKTRKLYKEMIAFKNCLLPKSILGCSRKVSSLGVSFSTCHNYKNPTSGKEG